MSLVKSMHGSSVLLTDEDRALLLKVSGLLEEIIETLEILADEDTVKSIREAEEDVKAGRVRDYNEFLKELKQSGEI
jgi:chorismate mutase